MQDYFVIPNNKIDPDWNPLDKSLEFYLLDYCEEVLDIPLFIIRNTTFTHEGLEIELQTIEDQMISEDWYINLFRISNYAKAS